jgi:DNA polymerase III epsilon subunit-like protein
MGLKVVAIDCEMVGCIRKIPREQLLAMHMKKSAAQGNKGGGGGGGVLLKTKMKPPVFTSKQRKKLQKGLYKEMSVAARCSIVAYDGTVLYDKYINPTIGTRYTITNYRTPWSGIKPSHMTGATPFHVARQEILEILRGCIVIGHNIGSDMQSLEIHNIPASQIRDTSFHPTLKKNAGGSRALKKMSYILLGRNIQMKSRVGHCSVEDATATMDLYKLVELEWEQ